MVKRYVVQSGDCISSIAYEHGFFAATIWDAADNAALRQVRAHPNLLVPGDVVEIPDKRQQQAACPTDRRTVFRRRGVPARLNLTIVDDGEPCAGAPYVLVVDGQRRTGALDGEGRLSVTIAPNARSARLIVGDDDDDPLELELYLGRLHPPDEPAGVRARLENLGYTCRGETGALGPATAAALRSFQAEHGLAPSGELDAATRDRLLAVHGA